MQQQKQRQQQQQQQLFAAALLTVIAAMATPAPTSATSNTVDVWPGSIAMTGSNSAIGSGWITTAPSTLTAFTLEAWVYLPSTPTTTYGAVFGSASYQSIGPISAPQAGYVLYITQTQTWGCQGATGRWVQSAPAPTDQWFHMACTYDGTTLALYQNGALLLSGCQSSGGTLSGCTTTFSTSMSPDPPTSTLAVGTHQYNGVIAVDNARLWQVARSSSVIGQYYNTWLKNTGVTTNLWSYVTFQHSTSVGVASNQPGGYIAYENGFTSPPLAWNPVVLIPNFLSPTTTLPVCTAAGCGTGAITSVSASLWFPSNAGQDVRFSDATFGNGLHTFTLEAWFMITAAPASNTGEMIVSRNRDTGGSGVVFALGLNGAGQPQISCGLVTSTGPRVAYSSIAVPLNTWIYEACTYDGTNIAMYRGDVTGGALQADASYNGPSQLWAAWSTTNLPWTIGSEDTVAATSNNNQFVSGAIDDVRIWNRVRPQSELQSSYNTMLKGIEVGLLAYVGFRSGPSGTISVADYSSGPRYIGGTAATWSVFTRVSGGGALSLLLPTTTLAPCPANGCGPRWSFTDQECTQNNGGCGFLTCTGSGTGNVVVPRTCNGMRLVAPTVAQGNILPVANTRVSPCFFNKQWLLYYLVNDGTNRLGVSQSSDGGLTWSTGYARCGLDQCTSNGGPKCFVSGGTLHLLIRGSPGIVRNFVSTDGTNFNWVNGNADMGVQCGNEVSAVATDAVGSYIGVCTAMGSDQLVWSYVSMVGGSPTVYSGLINSETTNAPPFVTLWGGDLHVYYKDDRGSALYHTVSNSPFGANINWVAGNNSPNGNVHVWSPTGAPIGRLLHLAWRLNTQAPNLYLWDTNAIDTVDDAWDPNGNGGQFTGFSPAAVLDAACDNPILPTQCIIAGISSAGPAAIAITP